MKPITLLAAIVGAMSWLQSAPAQDQPPPQRSLLLEAEQMLAEGRADWALKRVDQYIAAAPKDAKGYLLRAAIRDSEGKPADALPDYDQTIELDPKQANAYQRRGIARFMSGRVKESIEDFDKYIEARPEAAPHHWQRGIALYYAGRYEDGAKQFELHRTVNPKDVENAAWHFLCVARWKDPDAAKAVLIPIEGDARVPMMTVHKLFAGKATPDDVMTEAKRGEPAPAELNRHLFYAHLYLGLYFEAVGKAKEAREHLDESIKHEVPDYMYGVAKVHVALLDKAAADAKRPK